MLPTASRRLISSVSSTWVVTLSSHRHITIDVTADEFENARPFEEIPNIPLVYSKWMHLPILGRYDIYKRDVADMHKFKKYGKIHREGRHKVVLYDLKDFEKMFRYEGVYPMRGNMPPLSLYAELNKQHLAEGLITSEGHEWKEMRLKVQKHLMRPKSVTPYLPDLNEVVDDMVNRMEKLRNKDGEIEDFLLELTKYSLEAVSLIALDTRLGCLKDGLAEDSEQMQMVDAVRIVFKGVNDMGFGIQLWKYFPTPKWRKFSAAMDNFRNISRNKVAEVKNRLLERNDRKLTLMETLLVEESMNESEAAATIIDMLLAGVDTTATAMGFNFYFLARNPDVQEKAYQEVIKLLPNHQDSVTSAVLDELRYVKACLKESQRLAPIITCQQRTLGHDAVFSGFKVPAGTLVQANSLVAGLLEENFPEPKMFKPERWLKENRAEIQPFSYLSFSYGPRMCVGKRIAEQEMWTLIAKVLRRYRLEYHHEDIGLKTHMVHVPEKPLRISFIPRK